MSQRFLAGAPFAALLGLAAGTALVAPAWAADPEPIRIGVIAENQAIGGVAITNAAHLAADELNAKGGVGGRKIEIIEYDDHSSSADAVRAFQRAVNQDHVAAVIASYISEVVLALEPWAARLKTPLITPGAASNEISRAVHDDYARNKYTFHGYLTSSFLAQAVCDFSHDILVGKLHMTSTVVMSEDAAWTTPLDDTSLQCLPEAGLKVLDHIRFSPDTTDFTPLFNQIEAKHPDVITTGISHVGVQPTVQWASQQVPIPMAGISSQATTTSFWRDTNGAAQGVLVDENAAPDVAVTPKTIPFATAYAKRFGITPGYAGYSAADDVNIIAEAVQRAGSTDADKLVEELEKTDYVGTYGKVAFYGRNDQYTHALKYGPGYITTLVVQWQDGKQVTLWPENIANGKLTFPSFIKLPQPHAAQ
ncbi:MAG: ABC transporter substrate-binding protein [Acidisphaera sp.]|nr:ABC transporter substrate-binding protein [Acidisphaera sp.]